MWRIFRWLDGQAPDFHKATVMVAGLAAVAGLAFLMSLIHTAAGVVFGYVAIFALLRASHVYRFTKKEPEPPQSGLPISQASDREILRRVRRRARTEWWRRHILHLAAHDQGPQGDRARRIVASWKEAEARRNQNSAE
jgi:hypothetical protein